MTILILIVTAFLAVSAVLDIHITNVGIKKGVAVEGNAVIGKIFGEKPTLKQLILFWSIFDGLLVGLTFVPNTAVSAFFIGACAIQGIKHIRGYLAWKKFKA